MKVTFENVSKRYGDVEAVAAMSLTIEDGALHFLLGPSGCGKTTCLRMLAGLEDVTSGRILFAERDVTRLAAADRGVGMVFQNYALWPHMNVRKNIEYGLKLRKLTTREMSHRLDNVLEITQLAPFVDRMPGTLSGGQQQRVALARALAIRPAVLLLDEPLSNLDAKLRMEMRDNISRIHRQTGITTVYVTHDQREALSMGTSISVMRSGRLIQTGAPRELYNRPVNGFIAGFVGETNLVRGSVVESTEQGVELSSALGALRSTPDGGQFASGDDVLVSMRPETMRITFGERPRGAAANRFKAAIEHLTYLGDIEQFQLHTPNGERFKVNVSDAPEHSLKSGDSIEVSVAAADVIVLPPESDLSGGT